MFEILEHTADIGFRAQAPTLPELFESAAEALVSVAMEINRVTSHQTYALQASGDSNESLLVNWLSEVLYLLDGEHLALGRFQVTQLAPGRVQAIAFGERRDPARHPAKMVVKGVTYHQLKIEQTPHGWSCEVYLDI
jgi:protein archease